MSELTVIAHIETDFPEKFGIPRQSNLVPELTGRIVFEPRFRQISALRGLEEFDYIWLLWRFDVAERESFTATVKPPRLGGNARMGVFATRSPFRTSPIGLSCVKLDAVEWAAEQGPVLHISGADLRDNTEIYDIKPYLPYTDSHPQAKAGFTDEVPFHMLSVIFPDELLSVIPADKRVAVIKVLEQDPRPSYQDDPDRVYGMYFAGKNIRFRVEENVLTVFDVEDME